MAIRADNTFVPEFAVGEAWRAQFAISAGRAVDHWTHYVRQHRDELDALKTESANILHCIREAVNVPGAWSRAATLAMAFDPFMIGRGSWRHWANCLTALIKAPEAISHPVPRARLQRLLSTALARLGQVDDAVDQLKQAIRPLREAQAWNPLADALLAIAYWRAGAGQNEGIAIYLREAESLATRLGNQPVLIDVHHIRGRQALQEGRHEDAIASFQQALDLAQEAEHATLEKAARNFLAKAYLEADQPDAALPHLWQALEIARETGDRPGVGVILVNVGRAYLGLGRTHLARIHLQASLRMTRQTDNRTAECAALTALGDTHGAHGENTLAEGCYRQALQLARNLNDTRREARVCRALAALRARG